MDVNTKYEPVQNGIKVKLYNGYPYLYLQTSKKSEYTHAPDWYYEVEYLEEKNRGYESCEDLLAIGFFEFSIKKGDSIVFSAGTTETSATSLKQRFTNQIKKRVPRTNYENNLQNAAQQFFVKKDKKNYIIAGYPWFGIWARDTFISLPGLSLALNDIKIHKNVIETMGKELKNGLFPNNGIGQNVDYNSVDAPLWYIWAIQKYVYKINSFLGIWKTFGKNIRAILNAFKKGTLYGIKMSNNGLIYSGQKGKALTWMDAIVDGKPVTPRMGYNVEVNALWYNAIKFALEIAKKSRDNEFINQWQDLPEKIKNSFIEYFWDENKGYLADYKNDEEGQSWDVRPNQVIATSMPFTMLAEEQAQKVLKVVESELLTPKGLRTLSPKNKNYIGRYEGNQRQRDLAYHQGTAWPWLLGHFVEGYLKIHRKSGVRLCEKIYHGFEDEMINSGIGTISEIFDADPPYEARGAISQAWSVSEIFRIKYLIDKFKND